MEQTDKLHGGLVFFESIDHGLDGICRIVAATLEEHGHLVDHQSNQFPGRARITTHAYAVDLTLAPIEGRAEPDTDTRSRRQNRRSCDRPRPGSRLVIALNSAGAGETEATQSQLLLLQLLYRMVQTYGAKQVEWLDPATVLPAGRFMSSFAKVSPRRVYGHQKNHPIHGRPFAPVDEAECTIAVQYNEITGQAPDAETGLVDMQEEQALAIAFRAAETPDDLVGAESSDKTEGDIRRLTAWGMTAVVAFISGPVGLSLAAINLVKGEDFRLSTQVLSLTGFIAVVPTGSAMADILSLLPL